MVRQDLYLVNEVSFDQNYDILDYGEQYSIVLTTALLVCAYT